MLNSFSFYRSVEGTTRGQNRGGNLTNRTIKHEIKLQTSVIVILGILAVGAFANAFAPAFSVKDEWRNLTDLYSEARKRYSPMK